MQEDSEAIIYKILKKINSKYYIHPNQNIFWFKGILKHERI